MGLRLSESPPVKRAFHVAELGSELVDACLRGCDLSGELLLTIERRRVVLVDLAHLVAQVVELVEHLIDLALGVVHLVGPHDLRTRQHADCDGGNGEQGAELMAERHDGPQASDVTNALRTMRTSDTYPGTPAPDGCRGVTPTRWCPAVST